LVIVWVMIAQTQATAELEIGAMSIVKNIF
jgi:hypothetical protein